MAGTPEDLHTLQVYWKEIHGTLIAQSFVSIGLGSEIEDAKQIGIYANVMLPQ